MLPSLSAAVTVRREGSRVGPVSEGAVVIFGRDAERARIERLLDAVLDGTVGLALEGTPGLGKTTVWRDLRKTE